MDIFTPLRIMRGQLLGLKNYLTLTEKKHSDGKPCLFVDITEVHIHDNGTGVPRVTNGIRHNLHKFSLPYKIVEVYAKPHNQGFFDAATDKPIKVSKGDFFFALDFSKFKIPQNKRFITKLRKFGIPCWFFLHDLIPLHCSPVDCSFKKWFDVVKYFDGFIANSKTTEDEMLYWLKEKEKGSYNKDIRSGYIHLASPFERKHTDKKKQEESGTIQFLCVSTVNPHKRYDLIVAAFDQLWKEGFDISLCIVGKPGVNNQAVFNQIHANNEYNKRLIWHENFISDEKLSELYEQCDALIFASDIEGFGVPLIEAASYGKPLIVRDIPIFHEVTNEEATFFEGNSFENLADTIKQWLNSYKQGKIKTPNIKLYTWEESTEEVLNILFTDKNVTEKA